MVCWRNVKEAVSGQWPGPHALDHCVPRVLRCHRPLSGLRHPWRIFSTPKRPSPTEDVASRAGTGSQVALCAIWNVPSDARSPGLSVGVVCRCLGWRRGVRGADVEGGCCSREGGKGFDAFPEPEVTYSPRLSRLMPPPPPPEGQLEWFWDDKFR